MRRRYKANAAAAAPAATDLASDGYPSEGDANAGTSATIPGPYWFHLVTEAIVTVIEEAGLVPDDDITQFREALKVVAATQVPLADDAEHTGANPPGDEAATPRGVKAMIDALIGGAPAALDTLNELADALNDDADFHTTVTNALAARARLDGATFTGRARGLTRAEDDNGSDFATTAFVGRATDAVKDTVLASDFDLVARARSTQDLSSSLNSFRWIDILAGDASGHYQPPRRVRRADLEMRVETEELLSLIVQGDSIQLHQVNSVNGALTPVGNGQSLAGGHVAGFAQYDGDLLAAVAVGSSRVDLLEVNRNDGTLTSRASGISVASGASGVGLAPHGGALLMLSEGGVGNYQLHEIDPTDGSLSTRGASRNLHGAFGFGMTSHAGSLLAMAGFLNQVRLYEVNSITGELTVRGPLRDVGGAGAITVGLAPFGNDLFCALGHENGNTVEVFLVNSATGELTARGGGASVVDLEGLGLTSSVAVSGTIDADGILLDRVDADTLGLEASSAVRVHEIAGIA